MTTRALALVLAAALALAPVAARAAESARPRASAHPSYGLRLGAVSAVSSAASGTRTAAGGGAYALFDIPGLLADVSLDAFLGDSRTRFVAAGIGAYFPLLEDETTPYLGGGLKLGSTRFGGDGAFGLVPFAAAGVLIGRSWSPHIRLELAWFLATATERRAPGFASRHASGPVATFGIGF